MSCQKTYIIFYLIIKNKFLLKTNQNKKYFDFVLFPNKRKYIGIGQDEFENISISDISKNLISLDFPNIAYPSIFL